jgi:hypothetical protein
MTAAHSLRARGRARERLRYRPATPLGVRPTGADADHLPARRDEVSWATQALAAQGGGGVPAIPRRLEWSTAMVHSA